MGKYSPGSFFVQVRLSRICWLLYLVTSVVAMQIAYRHQCHWTARIKIFMHGRIFLFHQLVLWSFSCWFICLFCMHPQPAKRKRRIYTWVCTLQACSGGEHRDGGPLRGDAADLHVGEGAPSLAAAVGDRGRWWDDVLQPVEGDDEQRQQEHQQPEEEPHVDIDVALATSWGRCSRWRGGGRRGETEKSPIVYQGDSGLVVVHQQDVHSRHSGWHYDMEEKKERWFLLPSIITAGLFWVQH